MASRKLLFLTSLWWTSLAVVADALCPSNCTCYLDNRGRNAVLCKEGGLEGPLNLANISLDTEVLKITAPEDNMNSLTMSPVFSSFKKLEELHITRSNIPQLGMHFFYALNKLDVLDLSQNNITQPLDHNFRGLSNLRELYMDDNRIYSLPSGTFRYLPELKVLSIQRNKLAELTPRMFLDIKKLKVLKLSGNSLLHLNPVVFGDVQNLRTLECRACSLTKIDRQVYELLPHLTHLDLGDNELTFLTSDEFEPLSSLRYLKLDGNLITAIRTPFSNQHAMKVLNLARNGLKNMRRETLENLDNLTQLDLGQNKLEKVDPDLLEPVADTLEVLVLSGNHLKFGVLKELLKGLSLRELHISDCGFVDIPENIFPESLAVLNLADNYLSSIQPEVIPEKLQELDISSNRFRGLDEDVLRRFDNLKNLRLEQNPWSCDLCHIVPLLDRINRSVTMREIKCVQPFTSKGKKLGVIKRNELTWCTVPSYTSSDANFFLLGDDGRIGLIAAGTSVCLLFLTVIAALAALCYSRRHAAKYYTHEDKLAMEGDSIFDNHSPLFCEDRELSFKFPLDGSEKKLSVSTIDEIKKEHTITNGT